MGVDWIKMLNCVLHEARGEGGMFERDPFGSGYGPEAGSYEQDNVRALRFSHR